MKTFYHLLVNTIISSVTNFTVWFALIFFVYLETQSVLATSVISGLYLVSVALSGFWIGGLVDKHNKKKIMLASSVFSLIIYVIGFFIYTTANPDEFKNIESLTLWIFVPLSLAGVIAGNVRGIALPALVPLFTDEEHRDKANGLVGMTMGISFFIVSIISGILVGHSGMYLVLLLSVVTTLLTILHLLLIKIPENAEHKLTTHKGDERVAPDTPHIVENVKTDEGTKKGLDIRGTIRILKNTPGLLSLIFFTTFNNFLGGVFMSLMDAYGLSLVSVEVWGILWGGLSLSFILGGLIIAKRGLGKNPLRSLFLTNIIIWTVSAIFALQPSIILLTIGMFIYLAVVPVIEAAEHTIIQKVVPQERLGRVFGFAQSIEQAASPLMAFAIGPIAQLVFIPFMTTGAGVDLIGSWFGTGQDRGIALVFTSVGIVGLIVTLLAMRSRFYSRLSESYLQK